LSAGYHLEKSEVLAILKKVGLTDTTRAQELSVEQWRELSGEMFNIQQSTTN
jgi:hypothetical protein